MLLVGGVPPDLDLPGIPDEAAAYLSEPIRMSPPGRSSIEVADPLLIARVKDDIWYINICSDEVFEYRTVELPFELVAVIPPRNFSEPEWRGLGITQSEGWENFHRSGFEKNVLLFRKPRFGVSCADVSAARISQVRRDLRATESRADGAVCEVVNFPMCFWDAKSARPTGNEFVVELNTAQDLLQYQVRVLQAALSTSP